MISVEVRLLRLLFAVGEDGATVRGPPLAVEWTDGRTVHVTPHRTPPTASRWIPASEA